MLNSIIERHSKITSLSDTEIKVIRSALNNVTRAEAAAILERFIKAN